jgi:hypothetical protein
VAYTHAHGVTRLTSLYPGSVGVPCAYVSLVWNMPFSDVLNALNVHFGAQGGDPHTTFVWIFCFAHGYKLGPDGVPVGREPEAKKMLAQVEAAVSLAGTTLVVLDKRAVALRRAWCLLEMSLTQPHNLVFLKQNFTEAELADAFDSIPDSWDDIPCWFERDKRIIVAAVEARAGSLAAFRASVRLRLLLSPTSHAALVPLMERALGALTEKEEAVQAAAIVAVQQQVTAAAPVEAVPAALPAAHSSGAAQIMLSYRVPESGATQRRRRMDVRAARRAAQRRLHCLRRRDQPGCRRVLGADYCKRRAQLRGVCGRLQRDVRPCRKVALDAARV